MYFFYFSFFQSCDTILHTSCKFCYVDVVKFLLTCKEIDLKSKNKDGRTASEVITLSFSISILTMS